ncbi:MAG TPA: FAA hydrolase family protein [Thermoplasmatales archaeon]|nr:FAA hydrolase family protein [Thermoplasmatales archaeon]
MPYYRFKGIHKRVKIGKIICLARTYRKHAEEMDASVPREPLVFLKPASSVIFNNQTIIIPRQSNLIHHEVELGVVVGKKGKEIPKKNALDYVLGYVVALDITARDIQQEAKKHGLPWTMAKGFDTFCPISEVIPKEEVPNPHDLNLILTVNGRVKQSSNTKYMMYSIEEIIAFVSGIMTLEPGDLILTGTPEGVGPLYEGDKVEAKLGTICSLKVNVSSALDKNCKETW